jgi:hypothetical protein
MKEVLKEVFQDIIPPYLTLSSLIPTSFFNAYHLLISHFPFSPFFFVEPTPL